MSNNGAVQCFETHRSCDAQHRALGGIIGLAQVAVFEEAGERDPTLETVIDRVGGLALFWESLARCSAGGRQTGWRAYSQFNTIAVNSQAGGQFEPD